MALMALHAGYYYKRDSPPSFQDGGLPCWGACPASHPEIWRGQHLILAACISSSELLLKIRGKQLY